MVDRIKIKEKLKDFGMKFATIGISRPMYVVEDTFKTYNYNGTDDHLKYNQVETFKIEMLTEEDLHIIINALHFYSKSKNPQVEEMRREFMIMRRMMEDNIWLPI